MIFDLLHVRIRTKLLGLVLLPVVGGGLLSGLYIAEQAKLLARMRRVRSAARLSSDVSGLVRALQSEAVAASVRSWTKNPQDAEGVLKSREVSDLQRSLVSAALSEARGDLGTGLRQPGMDGKALRELRRRLDASDKGQDALEGYARQTEGLLQLQDQLMLPAAGTPLEGRFHSLASLRRAEESAGQIRTILAGAFAPGGLALGWPERLSGLVEAEKAQEEGFLSTAPAGVKADFQKAVSGASAQERQRLVAEALAGRFPQDPGSWSTVSAAHAGAMKAVEERTAQALLTEAQALENGVRARGIALTVGFSLFGLLVLGWTWRATFLITRPIQALADGMARLKQGDLTIQLPIQSYDETGLMTEAFNTMSARLRELVKGIQGHASRVESSANALTSSADQVDTATQQLARCVRIQREASQEVEMAVDLLQASVSKVRASLSAIAEGGMAASEEARGSGQRARGLTEILRHAVYHVDRVSEASDGIYTLVKDGRQILECGEGSGSLQELRRVLEQSTKAANVITRAGHAGGIALKEGEAHILAVENAMEQVVSMLDAIATMAKEVHDTAGEQSLATRAVDLPMKNSSAATGAVQLAAAQLANTAPEVVIATRDLSAVAHSLNAAAVAFQVK